MTTIDKHAEGAASWFDLMTPEPAKARAFYAGLFGWTFDVGPPETGPYSIAKVGDRDAGGIGQRPANAAFPSMWTCYFNTADVDAKAKAIVAAGGKIMMAPMDVMEQGRMAIATDPGDAVFGLWQPKQRTGAQVVSEPGGMGWQECHTHDGPKMRDFYATILGLEVQKVEGLDYWLLMRGETHFGGVMHDLDVPPSWLCYWDVADTDACVAKAKDTGARVIAPPFPTPHGRMSILADPWGAVFAVIQPPA